MAIPSNNCANYEVDGMSTVGVCPREIELCPYVCAAMWGTAAVSDAPSHDSQLERCRAGCRGDTNPQHYGVGGSGGILFHVFLSLFWTGFGFLFSQVFPVRRRLRAACIIATVLATMLAAIGFMAERGRVS